MEPLAEGTLLWTPPDELRRHSAMQRYMDWLAREKGLVFDDYAPLWEWSVADVGPFWATLWEFFALRATRPYETPLASRTMPGARWFPGAELSYTEHIFRHAAPGRPAIVHRSETRPLAEISWEELRRLVGAAAAGLRALGVARGDRVVAYLPNIPEAVVAFLACASIGAIWSSCSPDMGHASVADRFRQIEPKVLFAVDGYQYGGRPFDRRATVAALRRDLPTLEHLVLVPYLDMHAQPEDPQTTLWTDLLSGHAARSTQHAALPFDHPLWVLYSSGTTGLPKPIVQGQGGILLEHLKSVALHLDLGPGDRFFWFTTTGWMMWNFLVGGLLAGSTILLYDGSPAWPDMGALWRFAEESGMTFFGTSAAYIAACMKAGVTPGASFDLSRLRGLGSTGSPLPAEGFGWVYEQVKQDIWLASISGGTDLCTAFVGGCPLLPVYAGEIQCRCLGAKVAAYDERGRPVVDEVGELVLEAPMPSMPLFFWNDPGDRRYRESYFEQYPGVWRHGDWCKVTSRGTVVIYGRSDSTINRAGIRMGTSEMYRVVEAIPEVLDSLVIDLEGLGGAPYMALFVVLREGAALDEALVGRIRAAIREALSPRHVPDDIFAIPEVPRTLNGKKLEVPIKKILRGTPPEQAANPDAMANPGALAYFADLAERLRPRLRL
ncbi:MAG TPA: acetoacetate--CoA ligase [Roseiflexaceae bacterium]|nr:acetoacetate--CoA ligase [Roseiflexaceae bacterium]